MPVRTGKPADAQGGSPRKPASVVEQLEVDTGIVGHVKGDDDRRLEVARQNGGEAQGAHALDQDPAVLPVAPAAPGDAALGGVLVERLLEGGDHLDRRREAPLGGLFHRGRLLVSIEKNIINTIFS